MPPRRRGLTVRSVIDCCIAEIALGHEVMLVHDGRDFAAIGRLKAEFKPAAVPGLHEPGQTLLRQAGFRGVANDRAASHGPAGRFPASGPGLRLRQDCGGWPLSFARRSKPPRGIPQRAVSGLTGDPPGLN